MVTNNFGIDPNYRVAYVQMWNLNVQHELTQTLLLNIGYTGSKGSALDMLRAPNRTAGGLINPDVQPFIWETSQGSSILHAGSVRLRKRMTNGISVGGTYTYSKSIDNASSIGGGAQVIAQDDQNLRAERGLSSFDQRHKLTGDWMLELPWGEGRRWLTRPTIAEKGARQLAAAEQLYGRLRNAVYGARAGRCLRCRAWNQRHPARQLQWRTNPKRRRPQALVQHLRRLPCPRRGRYGDSGRNTIIGPGSWLMSLVLSKNIPLRDQMGVEMRAEADNVLNHANYSGIDTTVNSPTFGQVTSVASMRKMILSVHYRF